MSGRDPRLAKQRTPTSTVTSSYQLGQDSKQALTARKVDPAALASKPIHNPSMERIGRHAQLARKDTARTILPDLLNKPVKQLTAAVSNVWQGMFCKSQPDRKPKGSRNIPPSLQDHTAVPANCWPLLEAHEASANMWTATKPSAAKTRSV